MPFPVNEDTNKVSKGNTSWEREVHQYLGYLHVISRAGLSTHPPKINKNDLHRVKDNEKLRSGKVKLDETFWRGTTQEKCQFKRKRIEGYGLLEILLKK